MAKALEYISVALSLSLYMRQSHAKLPPQGGGLSHAAPLWSCGPVVWYVEEFCALKIN